MKHTILSTPSLSLMCSLVLAAGALHAQGMLVPEPSAGAHAGGAAADVATGDDQWNKGIGPFDVNGVVYETAVAPNGDLYIGGEFTSVGGVPANRIAKWNGTAWSALGTGIPAGKVYAIAFLGNDVIVGGNFKGAGGVKTSNIARFNGTAWTAFGDITNEGLDSTVLTIAIKGNDIYAAGNFTYAGNQDIMNFIAKWDPNEKLFVPLDDGTRRGTDGGIASMAFVGDSLYIAGGFTVAGATYASRIARWNGTAWSSLLNGIGGTGNPLFVSSMAVHDTSIVIVGTFTLAGGKPMKSVARWSLAGNAWSTVGPGGFDSAGYRVIVSPSGTVYAAGNFMKAGTSTAPHIAKWVAGAGWSGLASGLDAPAFALSMIGEDLWVGGGFTTAGGKASANLARWTEEPPAGVDDGTIAAGNALHAGVVPNPVTGICALHVTLAKPCAPVVTIVGSDGREVGSVAPGVLPAGDQTIRWDASALPAGIYFSRIRCAESVTCVTFAVVR